MMRFPKLTLTLCASACMLLSSAPATAQSVAVQDNVTTFSNPMAWADLPDPDVIRVGDYFYMVTTTMHLMPGAPIMRSRDLVNWELVSYLFDTINETPRYDMEGGTVYGKGQWATSLRYHNGTFYALFSPNDHPYRTFIYRTDDPAKGWTIHSRMNHFHDASLFFDDDGRVYVFSGTGHLRELRSDLSDVKEGGVDTIVVRNDDVDNGLLEGSRVVKHNGKYYLLMISWPRGGKRRQLCYRADNITGPYEKKTILLDNFANFPYVGQGTIVDDANGNWWGVIFQDRGAVGRVLTLSPCTWIDGWPILGDSQGKVPHTWQLPVVGEPHRPLVISDDFGSMEMKREWQWNHNPINTSWSLTDRKGWLRLYTNKVVSNIYEARNTLTQRMEGPRCSGVIELDLRHMTDGDRAGLSAFNGHSGNLTVCMDGKEKSLVLTAEVSNFNPRDKSIKSVDREERARISLGKAKKVWLKVNADFNLGKDIATFEYSLDGKRWNAVGNEFRMQFDYTRHFMGTKFGIFCYATKQTGGYVDVNDFEYVKHSN